MKYVRIYWKGPFTLDELQSESFGYDTRFNFYLFTTLDIYRDPKIKYIGKTTQTILERLENHHKWNEIRESIENPLRERIDFLIEKNSRMKLFIESLVDNLEKKPTLLGRIIRGLQMNDIFIFVGQGEFSRKPFGVKAIDRFNPAKLLFSNPITDDYIDPIENALIYSIKPEYNDRLKQEYLHPEKQMMIRSMTRSILIDDIYTNEFWK